MTTPSPPITGPLTTPTPAVSQPAATPTPTPTPAPPVGPGPGNITIDYVGDDLSNNTDSQYSSIVWDDNNLAWLLPYAADTVVKFNPRNDTTTQYSTSGVVSSTITEKYVGAETASNGYIYVAAYDAPAPLRLGTSDYNNPTLDEVPGWTSSPGTKGIAYKNGWAFMPSYDNQDIHNFTFDSTGNEFRHGNITFTVPQSGSTPRSSRLTNVVTADEAGITNPYSHYWGIVADDDSNKLYLMPYSAPYVAILDQSTRTVDFTTHPLSGNADVSNSLGLTTSFGEVAPFANMYRNGVLASNGCIYAHGYHARAILKIDTATDEATEIPYPSVIINAMLDGVGTFQQPTHGGKAASNGSILAANGDVYSIPTDINYLIWIDPSTDTISYQDITTELAALSGDTDRFADGITSGDLTYYCIDKSEKVAEVEIGDLEDYNEEFEALPAASPSTTPTATPPAPTPTPPAATPTPQPSNTPAASNTPLVPTPTPSQAPGTGVIATPTPQPSNTPLGVTPTPQPSNTPIVPTPTPSNPPPTTPLPSNTPQPSNTPAGATPTPQPSNTPAGATPTPQPSNTPAGATPTPQPSNTPVGPTPTPQPSNTPVGPTPTPPVSNTPVGPTPTPQASSTPQSTPSYVPPTPSYVPPSMTPPVSESFTPTPTTSPSNSPTPSITPSPSDQKITPTPSPSRTPSNPDEVCYYRVKLEFDAGARPTRWTVTYEDEVIHETGYRGTEVYDYGHISRQVFTGGLDKYNLDFSDLPLSAIAPDGYPYVTTPIRGEMDAIKESMTTNYAYVRIQSPMSKNWSTWTSTLNCPVYECIVPGSTPQATPTPTPSQTPTQTPTGTPVVTPSPTPSETSVPPSMTATPTVTPSPTDSPMAPTPTATPTASVTPTISNTPSATPSNTPSISITPSNTPPPPSQSRTPQPTPSKTPSSTPTGTPTPFASPSQTATQTPTPSITPSHTPPPTPSNSSPA